MDVGKNVGKRICGARNLRESPHALLLAGVTILSLSACGGGGGGGDAGSNAPPAPTARPPAPILSLNVGLKQLQFSWTPVADVATYRLMVNPDGASGFVAASGTLPFSQTSLSLDVAVHAYDWANARYFVEACNAAGCSRSGSVSTMNRMLEAIGYFKASNADAGDNFGYDVALSADGATLAITSRNEDSAATGVNGAQADDSADGAGAVFVFRRGSNGVWSQDAYLKPSNTLASMTFGISIALDAAGDTLAVSALREASAATGVDGDQTDTSAPAAGAVYVFERSNGGWSQQAYVKASNTEGDDRFGAEVALSADGLTLAVSSLFEASAATGIGGDESDNSADESGAVYVYRRIAGAWGQQAYLKASNSQAGDSFGSALALSADGTTLAVGASSEDSSASGVNGDQDDNSVGSSGALYVFARNGSAWSQNAYLKASNPDITDQFGSTLDLSDDGNTLAVGARAEDSSTSGVNGDDDDDSLINSGAAYVFQRVNGVWSQEAYVKASNPGNPDSFGLGLELSGDGTTLAVGSRGESSAASGVIDIAQTDEGASDSGAVYVFRRDAGGWAQRAIVKATNTGQGDWFGFSVALDFDGSTLAVGGHREDSAGTGIGGEQVDESAVDAGAAYLY